MKHFFDVNVKPPPRHPKFANRFRVPDDVRPGMQRTAIEVLCWGVRNMSRFQLLSVTSPFVEFEIGGQVKYSSVIKNSKRNPNFPNPLLFFDVVLLRSFSLLEYYYFSPHAHTNFTSSGFSRDRCCPKRNCTCRR